MATSTSTSISTFDLYEYSKGFEKALRARYSDRTFKEGFARVRKEFEAVRSGRERLNADHVMSIFKDDLPYVEDWTKPDRANLEERMEAHDVGGSVDLLRSRPYDRKLISSIRYGLRELTLTALVLQHVYPNHYAMCSHHLASLLYIKNASTLPEFYIEYCKELQLWGEEASSRKLNVEEAEFALWTWYRLANFGREEEKKKHRKRFGEDPWVRKRRAEKIAASSNTANRLEIAWAYLAIDPTLAAVIGWLEFELKAREIVTRAGVNAKSLDMNALLKELPKEAVQDRKKLVELWYRYTDGRKEGRNEVMHHGVKLDRKKAESVLRDVTAFFEFNDW